MLCLRRSVLLCLLVVVATPAPADAWFEWLHRLSGPGPWYGPKVDVRAACFGSEIPDVAEAKDSSGRTLIQRLNSPDQEVSQRAETEFRTNLARLKQINASLGVLPPDELDAVDRDFNAHVTNLRMTAAAKARGEKTPPLPPMQPFDTRLQRARSSLLDVAALIVTPGIFVSLCPSTKVRSAAIELGVTALYTPGNESYANDNSIWMMTFTGGLSYRVPLPVSRDFIDLGANVGLYRFYSKGFENFSGVTLEPYIDLHLPTNFRRSASATERFFGRFTVRTGLQFFPGGFEASDFAYPPGTPDISGREATPSITVFFALR